MGKTLLELARERVVIFDGAMGTMLMAAGLAPGESPELWNLDRPEEVTAVHRQYYEAGSDVVHTNTFGANPVKLADRSLGDRMDSVNRAGVVLARRACPDGKWVAGDIGPTGKMLKPLGDLSPEEAEEGFLRQAEILIQEGVDLISIETMFSLEETLLALRAAKAAGSVPVSASVTFTRTKKGYFTLMGEGVSQCVAAMEGAEADVVASNCTLGSSDMIDLTAQMAGAATRPLLIQPNAGNPVTRKGVTTYEQSPEDFARDSHDIWKAGASMLGGCCGTDPRFIRTLVGALDP